MPTNEFDVLPKLDSVIRFEKPDMTQIAIHGQGPANRPIRVDENAGGWGGLPPEAGMTGYTYDGQGRLLASYDPTVYGYSFFTLGHYEGNRLERVYHGTTDYPKKPAGYASWVTQYGYNAQQQIRYTLTYHYLGEGSSYGLTYYSQFSYTPTGAIRSSRLTFIADGSYRQTVYTKGKPLHMETFTRTGELKERIDYTFDNQPNPLADLYFFSLDPDYTGQATNLIGNQGPYGMLRREYRSEYDDQQRVRVLYRREKPTDSWIAAYRFMYGQYSIDE